MLMAKFMTNKKSQEPRNFQSYLKKLLTDPKLKRYYNEYYEQLKISYRILKMKKKNSKRWAEQ
jgi:predicted nucleotidyltransferase